MPPNITVGAAIELHRYKFACETTADAIDSLAVSEPHVQTRGCSTNDKQATFSLESTIPNNSFVQSCISIKGKARDGGWSSWSNWSTCTAVCGDSGEMRRSRMCNNPKPIGHGLPCAGHAQEVKECNRFSCQVWPFFKRQFTICYLQAEWSCWSQWSSCSSYTGTCGGLGSMKRERKCTHKPGQEYCEGWDSETRNCNMPACHGWMP